MVRFHTKDGRVFDLRMRGRFSDIRSEARFRQVVEKSIRAYEEHDDPAWQAYGQALRAKWEDGQEFDVISNIFAMLSGKTRIR